MNEKLEFEEDSGKIKFGYTLSCDKNKSEYNICESVSLKIVRQGKEAILAYAQNKIEDLKKQIQKNKSIEDEIRKNHIKIQTTYPDGTQLEGRIVEATSRHILVELDKPLQGSSSINFGFASAMSGRYIFNVDHQISEVGFEGARTALGWAYRDALHKPEIDLVERLNQTIKAR